MRKVLAGLTMVAALAIPAATASADPDLVTGVGSKNKGAVVVHCNQAGFLGTPAKGVAVLTPSGKTGGRTDFITCLFGNP